MVYAYKDSVAFHSGSIVDRESVIIVYICV